LSLCKKPLGQQHIAFIKSKCPSIYFYTQFSATWPALLKAQLFVFVETFGLIENLEKKNFREI
jgi:hypothetical protein